MPLAAWPASTAGTTNGGTTEEAIRRFYAALDAAVWPDLRKQKDDGLAWGELALPVVVTLARATIVPGDRYALPPPPAEPVIVTVDRAQAFSLTGGNFNRGSSPMPVYVLTFTTVGPGEGTPTA